MRRFEEVGLRPKTRHGQNFLIDLNLLRLLCETADLGPEDVVLEVGTGTGSLTGMMAPRAGHVVSVEVDGQLYQLASEALYRSENVTLLRTDALRNKNHFNPEALEAVAAQLDAAPGRRFKLAANLPYNVATPVVSNALALDRPPVTMTITIQKELAERMTASPGTKDYGALSVWMQSQCRVEIVRVMPPQAFWPRPKVESAIVHVELDPESRAAIADLAYFHDFVRSIFWHRRKFLRSVAQSAFKGRLEKPEVDEVLVGEGLGPDARAEQLDVGQMLSLCEAFRRIDPSAGS